MNFFDETIENAIYTWVYSVLGITTIWSYQDRDVSAPSVKRPSLPFVLLNVLSGPYDDGGVDKTHKSTDTWEIDYKQAVTISINIYSNDSHMYYATKLIRSLSKETVLSVLRDAGLVYRSSKSPSDLSFLSEDQFELRAGLEVVFAFNATETDAPGEIRKVGIQKTNEPTFDILVDAS